jgi:hypothetical protein
MNGYDWFVFTMNRVRGALMLFLGALGTGAQTTLPTTGAVIDLSSPRGALRALSSAMQEGDTDAIREVFLAANPAEERIIEADAQMAGALARLRSTAIKAFGAEQARFLIGDAAAGSAQSLASIDAADISVKGDTATVKYGDQKGPPFILKHVNGQWRVPASNLGKPLDARALEQRLSDLEVQRKVVDEMASLIRAGKFATAEQAREAWQARILPPPTSRPATASKD